MITKINCYKYLIKNGKQKQILFCFEIILIHLFEYVTSSFLSDRHLPCSLYSKDTHKKRDTSGLKCLKIKNLS